jgi:hypothetical protein
VPLASLFARYHACNHQTYEIVGAEILGRTFSKAQDDGQLHPPAPSSHWDEQNAPEISDEEGLWRGCLIISRGREEEGSHRLGRPEEGLFRSFDHESGGRRIKVEFQVHCGLESFSVGRSIESVQ